MISKRQIHCRFAGGPGIDNAVSRTAELRGKISNFPGLAVFNRSHVDFFFGYHQIKVQISVDRHTDTNTQVREEEAI